MSDDAPILGVAPIDPVDEPAPELTAPAPEPEAGPIRLDRQGRKVLAGVLKVEGELVRSLRGVPADEPQAWRWTDEEIAALMPAFDGLAERYGIAQTINDNAPQAGAVLAIAMHANRSLAAERAWAAAHDDTPTDTPEPPDVPGFDPGPVPEPAADQRADEPAGEEPGAGLGPADLSRVADHLGSPRVGGGR